MNLVDYVQTFVGKVNNNRAEAAIVVQFLATIDGVKVNSDTEAFLVGAVALGFAVAQVLENKLKAKTAAAPATK